MSAYTIPEYLLDRANIHDTVTKVPLYYDTTNLAGLAAEVYADSIEVDYTSLLGGEPYTISRQDFVDKIRTIMDGFASCQHITTGVVANLPQPAPGATRPETVLVRAQVNGNLVGKPSEDGTLPLTQNGGLLEAELRRDLELEKQGINPWRITKYKVIKRWDRGETKVLDSAKD
ncbi:hypothetical protein VTK26DRAFT_1586 [Humicola hyalothermophila]